MDTVRNYSIGSQCHGLYRTRHLVVLNAIAERGVQQYIRGILSVVIYSPFLHLRLSFPGESTASSIVSGSTVESTSASSDSLAIDRGATWERAWHCVMSSGE